MMQRQHYAARSQLHPLGDHRNGRARDRRVRIKPTELMKMPFRCPDRREAMLVRELRSVDQQPVLVSTSTGITGEVEQAEIHFFLGARRLCLSRPKRTFVRL